MSARDNILRRVRESLNRQNGTPMEAHERVAEHLAAHPVGPRPALPEAPVARFIRRARDMNSTVAQVTSLQEVPAAVAQYLAEQQLPVEGVCWPHLGQLDWAGQGLAMTVRPAIGSDLVGITGAFAAIAETGTLMFLSGPQTPAAASLLPETHICILPESRIVPYMEDGWALLRNERGQPPRAVNFVSGPSRTADIEQVVSLGAHGPYRVHIILVGDL